MPQVSVVLPVYNAASTIERAVSSVLQQTLSDIELVVVNDGSADGTKNVLQNICDIRLRVIDIPHSGVATAANTGTDAARADIIARMDADDVSHPQRLERQLQLLNEQNADAVGCQVRIVRQDGSVATSLQRYQQWINDETLTNEQIRALRFVELPLVNPTIMARRLYFAAGFRDNEFPEDYDLMLRAAENGAVFGKVPAVLYDWTDSAARLTRNCPRYSDDAFMQCRRHFLQKGPLSDVSTIDLWGAGQTGKPWLRWLQSCGLEVRKVIDVSSRKIGTRIHDTLVTDPDTMPPADGTPLIIAVGAAGARPLIRSHITARGYREGTDAWFVA